MSIEVLNCVELVIRWSHKVEMSSLLDDNLGSREFLDGQLVRLQRVKPISVLEFEA